MSRGEIGVGDITTFVVTETNQNQDRDPVSQYAGTTVFLRYPNGMEPEFGEAVRARIADKGENHYVAVVMERGDEGGDE